MAQHSFDVWPRGAVLPVALGESRQERGGDVACGQCLCSVAMATIPRSVAMEISPGALKFSLRQVL